MAKPDLSAINPLPLRVAHQPYETAYSLLSRLALRNGCKSLPHLFQRVPSLLGIPKWPRRELAIELAAALSSSSKHIIARCTPRYRGKQATIENYSGQASALTFKICVQCVAEDTANLSELAAKSAIYVRYFWHFNKIEHCRKHWLKLASVCRQCKAPFSYASFAGFRCSCTSDIRTQTVRESKPADIIKEYHIYEKMDRLPAGYGGRSNSSHKRRISWSGSMGEDELSMRQLMLIGPSILQPQLSTPRWDVDPEDFYIMAVPYLFEARDERKQWQRSRSRVDR